MPACSRPSRTAWTHRASLTASVPATRDERAAEQRQSLREVREAMLAKLSGSEERGAGPHPGRSTR